MAKASRWYLSWKLSSDALEAQERVWELQDALQELSKHKRIRALVRALHSAEEIEQEGLELERVLEMSAGRLPVLFLNLAYPDTEVTPADLAEIEARFELHLFGTASEMEP